MSPRKKKKAPDDEVLRDAEGEPVEDPTLSGILPPIPEAQGAESTYVTPQGDDQPTVLAREWTPPSPPEPADEPAQPEPPLEPAPLGEQPPEPVEEPPPAPEPEPEPVAVEPEPEPEPVAVEPEPEPEPAAAEPLPEREPVSETFVEPSYEPSDEPAYEPTYEPAGAVAAPGPPLTERPEVLIGAAFAGGIVLAILIRRLGR